MEKYRIYGGVKYRTFCGGKIEVADFGQFDSIPIKITGYKKEGLYSHFQEYYSEFQEYIDFYEFHERKKNQDWDDWSDEDYNKLEFHELDIYDDSDLWGPSWPPVEDDE